MQRKFHEHINESTKTITSKFWWIHITFCWKRDEKRNFDFLLYCQILSIDFRFFAQIFRQFSSTQIRTFHITSIECHELDKLNLFQLHTYQKEFRRKFQDLFTLELCLSTQNWMVNYIFYILTLSIAIQLSTQMTLYT